MRSICFLLCLFGLATGPALAQPLTINPAKPQRGDLVTITYHAGAPGTIIGVDAKKVTIVFTYSTFYELPYQLPMEKKGADWVASFRLQRYATFATFYLQSGDLIEKPAPDQQFSIPVYKGHRREKSSLLHEAYSLSVQRPKSKDLQAQKLALIQQELAIYPNNYEAKVALLNTKMNLAKTPVEKLKWREEARKVIAARLEENPTDGGNINSVTMGYLMIGEKTRVDSVRDVVMKRFPDADVSIDRRAGQLAKLKDSVERISGLEALQKKTKHPDDEGSTTVNNLLFEHYAAVKDSVQALKLAARLLPKNTPYTAERLKDIAATLTKNRIAPGAAISYAERAYQMADTWPVGVIRYFPEYGYIPGYVADSVRTKAVAEAKTNLLAIIALNHLYLKQPDDALKNAQKALSLSSSREGLLNVAAVYEQTNSPQPAFNVLWRLLLKNPTDNAVLKAARINFLKFNPSTAAFNSKVDTLKQLEMAQLTRQLQKQMMNKPAPELSGLVDLTGKPVTLTEMKGKIVILDFWATWCVPCMQELPYLKKVYDQYRSNPNVVFMVVNSGANNTIEDARRWTKQNTQYNFPIYFNNDKDIGDKVGFAYIPTIAVIDQQGRFQFRTVGFEGEVLEKKLTAAIEILLRSAE